MKGKTTEKTIGSTAEWIAFYAWHVLLFACLFWAWTYHRDWIDSVLSVVR